jgi:hypothetical protein
VRFGDLSGDGIPDLVEAGGGSMPAGAVAVSRGVGDGSFNVADVYAHGADLPVVAIELGDLDGDGRLDLVVGRGLARTPNGALSVRRNEGGGALGDRDVAPSALALSAGPTGIALADVNGDGWLDAAVAVDPSSLLDGSVAVFLGDGSGGLLPAAELPMGRGPSGTQLRDTDGDGVRDLVVQSRADGVVSIRIGAGDGTFGPRLARFPSESMSAMDLGDVDGDGVLDVVASEGLVPRINVWLRPDLGTWQQELTDMPARTVEVPPRSPATSLQVGQAKQNVDRVAVRVRLAGGPFSGISLHLVSPRGERVALDESGGWGDVAVRRGHYVVSDASGGPLLGWQPAGDWVLEVDNAGDGTYEVADFAVLTFGRFQMPEPGVDPARPERIMLPAGATGTVIRGTTVGRVDRVVTRCALDASAGRSPEQWYELDLDVDRLLSAGVVADFDVALVVIAGRCAAADRVAVACDNDGWVGRNPRVAPVVVPAGPACIVVGGTGLGGLTRQGEFDLFIEVSDP